MMLIPAFQIHPNFIEEKAAFTNNFSNANQTASRNMNWFDDMLQETSTSIAQKAAHLHQIIVTNW